MDETLITHKFIKNEIHAEPIARPYLKEFFEFVFKNSKHVSIWTHGSEEWYQIVYNKIFKNVIPEGKSFHFVRTRDNNIISDEDIIKITKSCFEKNINILYIPYFKPLFIIYNEYPDIYNSGNTFIIDDKSLTYSLNVENAFPIPGYYIEDDEDTELLKIIEYIRDEIFI